jgi:hypothetical protein
MIGFPKPCMHYELAFGFAMSSLDAFFALVMQCYHNGDLSKPKWSAINLEIPVAEIICGILSNIGTENVSTLNSHTRFKIEFLFAIVKPGGRKAYRSSFIRDFMDLNVAMWTSNNALTPDPDR